MQACEYGSSDLQAPDVCYSWWILSALATIDRVHWIDVEKLA